eukprot:UN11969
MWASLGIPFAALVTAWLPYAVLRNSTRLAAGLTNKTLFKAFIMTIILTSISYTSKIILNNYTFFNYNFYGYYCAIGPRTMITDACVLICIFLPLYYCFYVNAIKLP